jgi:hypothetical protein
MRLQEKVANHLVGGAASSSVCVVVGGGSVCVVVGVGGGVGEVRPSPVEVSLVGAVACGFTGARGWGVCG